MDIECAKRDHVFLQLVKGVLTFSPIPTAYDPFASFILIHKKLMCCSAMLSKDLFSRLTDNKN